MSKSPYPYFTMEELTCPCGCGQMNMKPSFMRKVVNMRMQTGIKMKVTSAYRCPEYDKSIGGAGVHPTGRAIDINIYYSDADTIINLMSSYRFTGRGVKQHGPVNKRLIHMDDLDNGELGKTRPATWTYE